MTAFQLSPQELARICAGAVFKETVWLSDTFSAEIALRYRCAVHDALYTCVYGMTHALDSEWLKLLVQSGREPTPYWEPAEFVPELAALPHSEDRRFTARVLLADWVRNSIEEGIHDRGHITDAQMARLNPAVRSALYSALVALDRQGEVPDAAAYLAAVRDFEPKRRPKRPSDKFIAALFRLRQPAPSVKVGLPERPFNTFRAQPPFAQPDS